MSKSVKKQLLEPCMVIISLHSLCGGVVVVVRGGEQNGSLCIVLKIVVANATSLQMTKLPATSQHSHMVSHPHAYVWFVICIDRSQLTYN